MSGTIVIDGATDGTTSPPFGETILAPPLAPDETAILKDLPAHTADGATLVILPPCSPDLNPIGQTFAKLEPLLLKAAPTPSRHRKLPLPQRSTPSRQANAPTISPARASRQINMEMLQGDNGDAGFRTPYTRFGDRQLRPVYAGALRQATMCSR